MRNGKIQKNTALCLYFFFFSFLNWLWLELLTPDSIILINTLPLVCWDLRMSSEAHTLQKKIISINPRKFWGRICLFVHFYIFFIFFFYYLFKHCSGFVLFTLFLEKYEKLSFSLAPLGSLFYLIRKRKSEGQL